MATRRARILLVASGALLLAGCGPTPSPGDTAVPTPTPTASVSDTPESTPTTTAVPTAGDCPDLPGTGPVIYSVFSSDATTPITMSYMAFNSDGSIPVVTETVYGPVVSRIGYGCTDAASSANWTFTATSSSPDSVACVLAFGGKLVRTDSQYNEGSTAPMTAECTANPGK
jgi:hypothetical protein